MCDGWPAGPAPLGMLSRCSRTSERLSRRHATGGDARYHGRCPRFAHESDEISKAVYQALPLCIVAALQGYAEASRPRTAEPTLEIQSFVEMVVDLTGPAWRLLPTSVEFGYMKAKVIGGLAWQLIERRCRSIGAS
jgi:hypothetical protein